MIISSCGQGGGSNATQTQRHKRSVTFHEPDEPSTSPEEATSEKHENTVRSRSKTEVTEIAPPKENLTTENNPSSPETTDENAPEPKQTLTVELRQGERDSGRIALTFDAGASAAPTPGILSVLAQKGVHATFFLTGKWVKQNPNLAREIVNQGHEIGNHTYHHPDLTKISDDHIREELDSTEEIVRSVTGVSTKPYFRPPFGARNARVLEVASEDGYRCVYWTADSWDGFKKGIKSPEIESRVLDRAKDGSIVLMHCGSWPTVDALPHIIDQLRAQGYDLVKVSDL